MMTREMMVKAIETLGNDANSYEDRYGFHVTLNDYDIKEDLLGDREIVERAFDNPEAVNKFTAMLEAESYGKIGNIFIEYHFNGFMVDFSYGTDCEKYL